jgi:hypothetical protein
MATHKFQITYDEATDALTATHRCTVTVGGMAVGHVVDVVLDRSVADAIKSFIDQNRTEIERETESMAAAHVSAVAGRSVRKPKQITVVGGLSPAGKT